MGGEGGGVDVNTMLGVGRGGQVGGVRVDVNEESKFLGKFTNWGLRWGGQVGGEGGGGGAGEGWM